MGTNFSLRSLLSETSLPPNEARILMAYVLDQHYQLPRSALLSRDDMQLNAEAFNVWQSLESKRLQGEPIAYLIGKRGFHNIDLHVGPGVLIPRPETELLVEIGLREIRRVEQAGKTVNVLDLGTGSGAIALAIANDAPNVKVTATDQSPNALAIAQTNAKYLGLESRVQFFQGSWYEAFDAKVTFDLILSNPPYIANQDPHLLQGDLRYEPIDALTDHASGLTCLEIIIDRSPDYLKPNGLIAVEHGFDQSAAVVTLMKSAGFSDIQVHQDLAGLNRVVSARK